MRCITKFGIFYFFLMFIISAHSENIVSNNFGPKDTKSIFEMNVFCHLLAEKIAKPYLRNPDITNKYFLNLTSFINVNDGRCFAKIELEHFPASPKDYKEGEKQKQVNLYNAITEELIAWSTEGSFHNGSFQDGGFIADEIYRQKFVYPKKKDFQISKFDADEYIAKLTNPEW